jgi:hypothetical protein
LNLYSEGQEGEEEGVDYLTFGGFFFTVVIFVGLPISLLETPIGNWLVDGNTITIVSLNTIKFQISGHRKDLRPIFWAKPSFDLSCVVFGHI